MNSMISLMVLALFIEAVVQVLKPVWDENAQALTVPEVLSILIGIMVAVFAKLNMLDGLIVVESPILEYMFYIFTGVAIGRGPSFVHDLWQKLRAQGA